MFVYIIIVINILKYTLSQQTAPFVSGYFPYPGLQRKIVELQMPAANSVHPPTLQSYQVIYDNPCDTLPIVISSIVKLQWMGQIKFDFTQSSITLTSCYINLNDYPKQNPLQDHISAFGVLIAIFSTQNYAISETYFEYIETASIVTSQNFLISGHQNYQASILVAYQESIDFNSYNSGCRSPYINVVAIINNFSKRIRVVNDCTSSYIIKKFKLRMAGISMKSIDFGFYVSLYTDHVNSYYISHSLFSDILNREYYYSPAHFYGLQFLRYVRTQNGNVASFNLYPLSISNTQLHYFCVAYFYSKCPSDFPYRYNADCYTTCPSNTYIGLSKYACLLCSSTCLTCTVTALNCTSCEANKKLIPYANLVIGHTCVCDTNYLPSLANSNICLPCSQIIQYCIQCTSYSNCTRCQSGLIFSASPSPICGCPTGLTAISIWIDQSANIKVLKCVSRSVRQSCNDNVVKRISPAQTIVVNNTGLTAFGQSCQCQGISYVNNVCV